MTESNHALDGVPALIEERRRYEAWLAALEARRETTPGHVFDRVKGDYQTRLARVDATSGAVDTPCSYRLATVWMAR